MEHFRDMKKRTGQTVLFEQAMRRPELHKQTVTRCNWCQRSPTTLTYREHIKMVAIGTNPVSIKKYKIGVVKPRIERSVNQIVRDICHKCQDVIRVNHDKWLAANNTPATDMTVVENAQLAQKKLAQIQQQETARLAQAGITSFEDFAKWLTK